MLATDETVDLAEWIIDDTCLVTIWLFSMQYLAGLLIEYDMRII